MDNRHFSARLAGYFVIEARLLAVEDDRSAAGGNMFADYPVSLDYRPDIRSSTEAVLYTKIAVNGNRRPLPGYAIYVEAMSLFDFAGETPAVLQKEWLTGVGLGIAVGNLREVIAGITAYGPFGKYVLPEGVEKMR
jgi:hypothetical protein